MWLHHETQTVLNQVKCDENDEGIEFIATKIAEETFRT